jgi:phosphoribosyl-dephospho-CoA transferase
MYAIQECITPEKLVKRIAAELLRSPLPPIQCLPAVKQALSKLEWGPAGSVAFQLATGLSCVSPSSDLDLIIRSTDAITQFEARTLLQTIRNVAPTADVLLETEEGGIVLEEYAHHDAPWSLRTCNGPQLVWNLWHVDARGRAER